MAESVLAYKLDPVAFVKVRLATVPEVETKLVIVPSIDVSVLIVAILAINASPVAELKPKLVAKRFVEVVLVPVALTQVILVKSSGPESTRFSMVAVVAAKIVLVELVKMALGANKFVIVEEFEVRFVIEPVEALKLVTKRLTPVAETKVRFVTVPLVERRFVKVPVVALIVVALKVVTPSVSIVAFVAYKFVVVAFVEVTLPKTAFQRLVALPSENARSADGMRSEFTNEETAKKLVVAFVTEAFARVAVPVAVRSEVERPPKRLSVVVVKAPRAETLCRVSRPSVLEKLQFDPSAKQMA